MAGTSFRDQLIKQLKDRVDGIDRQIIAEEKRPDASFQFILECLLSIAETKEIIQELESSRRPPLVISVKVVNLDGPAQQAN